MPYYAFPCQSDHGKTSVVQNDKDVIIARCDQPFLATAVATALNRQAEHMARADAFAGMLVALKQIAEWAWPDTGKGSRIHKAAVAAVALGSAEAIPQPAAARPLLEALEKARKVIAETIGDKGGILGDIDMAVERARNIMLFLSPPPLSDGAHMVSGSIRVSADELNAFFGSHEVTPGLLARCESFISGFEDDEMQEGIPELLADLRAAMAGTPPVAETAPADDDRATDEEWQAAHDLYGSDDINIADDAEASRGENGVWVQAWVLVPNEADQDDACPHCGETAQDGSGTCITCGQDMSEDANG